MVTAMASVSDYSFNNPLIDQQIAWPASKDQLIDLVKNEYTLYQLGSIVKQGYLNIHFTNWGVPWNRAIWIT